MTAKPFVAISIDVESDMPNWVVEPETTLRNIQGIPRLQELFDEFGVRPTYLVTYPVAADPECIAVFKSIADAGKCEIGMHCHPWTTPPVSEEERLEARFLSNIPDDVVRQKLAAVTDRIRESFGAPPFSYRAGRFGLIPSHLRILEDLGYHVDTSVTPLVSWTEEGGPDYRDALQQPYYPSYLDVRRDGNSRILEIPVTISLTRIVPAWARWLYVRIPAVTHLRGLLSRDRLDVLDVVWAYPAEFSVEDIVRAADIAERSGAPIINFFMHSNEIWPGQSPYCRSSEDLEAYFERLRGAFEELVGRRGYVPCTLDEFYQHYVA